MKPLNPIIHQILQERFQVSALKPPRFEIPTPRFEIPAVPSVSRIREIPSFNPIKVEPVSGGVPKVRVDFGYSPEVTEVPETTIVDVIVSTEKKNPALVKRDDYLKLSQYLDSEVESAIQTGASNYDDIWMEVTKANPSIAKSVTAQDVLDNVITFKIEPSSRFTTTSETPQEMEPKRQETAPKVQPMPTEDEVANVQPEETVGGSVKTAIPALLPMLLPALQTVPIRKTNDKLRTRAKAQPRKDYGDEEEQEEMGPTGTEIQRQKEIEAELERPFRFDQDEPALELEKNLGKYGGTYVRR